MADDNTTSVVLDLDNSEFLSKMAESLGVLESLGTGGSEAVSGLTEKLGALVGVVGPIAVAILAIKTALDLTEEAEHVQQVQNAFDMMAKSVGLVGDELKDKLLAATHGLAGETETLQSANKAIAEMGVNSNRLPEIMETARKATVLFGGTVIGNFDNISRAMAMGNAKMLSHYGIVINATKAHQDFAKSIGTSAEYLSVAGQREAILNAALDEARVKFANVSEDSLKTTQNIQKMGVSFGELKEAMALAWQSLGGGVVERATANLSTLMHNLAVQTKAAFGSGEEKAAATREHLEIQIAQYNKLIPLIDKATNPGEYELQNPMMREPLDLRIRTRLNRMSLSFRANY